MCSMDGGETWTERPNLLTTFDNTDKGTFPQAAEDGREPERYRVCRHAAQSVGTAIPEGCTSWRRIPISGSRRDRYLTMTSIPQPYRELGSSGEAGPTLAPSSPGHCRTAPSPADEHPSHRHCEERRGGGRFYAPYLSARRSKAEGLGSCCCVLSIRSAHASGVRMEVSTSTS